MVGSYLQGLTKSANRSQRRKVKREIYLTVVLIVSKPPSYQLPEEGTELKQRNWEDIRDAGGSWHHVSLLESYLMSNSHQMKCRLFCQFLVCFLISLREFTFLYLTTNFSSMLLSPMGTTVLTGSFLPPLEIFFVSLILEPWYCMNSGLKSVGKL